MISRLAAFLFALACLFGVLSPGTSSAVDVSTLKGTYKIGELENTLFQPGGAPVRSIVGGNSITATFDGAGACTVNSSWKGFEEGWAPQSSSNLYDQVTAYAETPAQQDCTYTVSPDGILTLVINGTETVGGWRITGDGMFALKNDLYSEPNSNGTNYTTRMLAAVKQGSSLAVADFAGTYRIAEVDMTLFKPTDSTVRSILGGNTIYATFNNDGTCSVSDSWQEFEEGFALNSTSTLYDSVSTSPLSPSGPTSCTYTLSPQGALSISFGPSQTVSGWQISGDGALALKSAVLSEPTDSGNGTLYSARFFIGMRLGTGLNNSTLTGAYKIGELGSTLFRPDNSSVRTTLEGNDITITFDGAGLCSVTDSWKEFEESLTPGSLFKIYDKVLLNVDPPSSPTCTYSVASDGSASLTINGSETITGWQVSANGKYILKSGLSSSRSSNNSGTMYTSNILVGMKLPAPTGTASGTYTFTPPAAAAPAGSQSAAPQIAGTLDLDWTSVSFPCGGPSLGTETQTVASLTDTTMVWLENDGETMTWKRASGTAGSVLGTWSSIETATGNTYTLTLDDNGNVTANGTILLCNATQAFISGFSPSFGLPGTTVYINGGNFTPDTASNLVWFNNSPAPILAVSPNQLTVTVPDGATTGRITISAPSGVASSATNFAVSGSLITYTSRVTDSANAPLSGVLVELLGTNTTTTSDLNGYFTITVPSQTTFALRLSLTNYVTVVTANMSYSQNSDTSVRPYALFSTTERDAWYTQATVTRTAGTGTVYGRAASVGNPNMTLFGVTLTASDGTDNYPVCYILSNNVTCGGSATSTTLNGKFFILNVPDGKQITVTAKKSGYNDGTKIYQVAGDTVSEGRVTLSTSSPTFTYTGKVVDSSGNPLPNVAVNLYADDTTPVGTVNTDSTGTFMVPDMPSSTPFYLRFTLNGYIETYSGNFSVTANTDKTTRPYTLFTTSQFGSWGFSTTSFGVIGGSIKDNGTGSPISGATITAVNSANNSITYPVTYDDGTTTPVANSAITVTGSNGKFYVHDVPAGQKVTITATAATYTSNSRDYHVVAASKLTQGGIFLSSTIAGNITATPQAVNFGDMPVGFGAPQQIITLTNPGPGNLTVSAADMTGDGSQFSVDPGGISPCSSSLPAILPANQSCTLVASFLPTSPGSKAATLTFTSDAANAPSLAIALSGNGVAATTVTYTSMVTNSGATPPALPLSGVLVELLGTTATALTDSNGSFTITVPSQTTFALRLSLAGYVTVVTANMSYSQNSDTSIRPYALFTTTERDAWYSQQQANITRIAGTGTVYGRAASAGNPSMTLYGVSLTASDGTNSYPVCYILSNNVTCGGSATSTTPNGKFFVLNVPDGKQITVTAKKGGYNDGTKVYQVAGDTISEGRVTLSTSSPTYTYTGKVVDSSGTPLSGVGVNLYADDNTPVGTVNTDGTGTFMVADLPTGIPFYLRFTLNGYIDTYSGNFSVTSNTDKTTRPYTLFTTSQFTGWGFNASNGVIGGSIKDNGTGSPIGGATITAVNTANNSITYPITYDDGTTTPVANSAITATGSNGKFYVHDVPAGVKVTIAATATGYTNNSRDYHVVVAGKLTQGGIFLNSATAGNITATPQAVNFGSIPVGTSATQQVITVGNSGPGSLTVSSAVPSGDPTLTINSGGNNPCLSLPHTFAAGESCTLVASFAPTSLEAKSASMTITSDAVNAPSLVITLSGTGMAAVPGAPSITQIIPWDGQATVYFNAPNFDGGSTIQSYTVTANPGNLQFTAVSAVSNQITATGLTNGTLYTFTVTATNTAGTGSPSTGVTSTPIFAPVRIGKIGYPDISAAYNGAANSGSVITMQAAQINSPMSFALAKDVTITGGYSTDYSGNNPAVNNGFTTFVGRVNISAGRVVFNNIKIK